MNRKLPVSVSLAITIIAMTVTFSITWLVSMNRFDATFSSVTQLQAQYSKLAEIDNFVRGNYYGAIDEDILFDRVAAGYISGLGDRFSTYYTAAEYAEITGIENGTLLGVGIELERELDGRFRIIRVYEDSPAAKAGLAVADPDNPGGLYIAAVNGTDAATIPSLRAMQSLLRGEEGTELVLDCRHGVAESRTYTIRRIAYTAPTVESVYIGDYAFVRISAFTPATYTEFDYAVRTARTRGVKGFVFDVRGNANSRFANSYDIIDLLCPLGQVAKSEGRDGTVRVRATSDENAVDLPMVVLVNGNTSAAAELFAVSVRDLAGGQIVGTRTAGRGTYLSSPFRLPDGSAVVVTEALLLTGKDEVFDGVGIAPNVEAAGDDVTEEMLCNPAAVLDSQIMRGFEVLRALVRERGEDPGPAINAAPLPPGTSSGSTSASASGGETGSQPESASTGDASSAPSVSSSAAG